ncbi:MAG: hypothetical protein ACPLKP_00930 [Microgenomates group bacterium]
MSPEQIPGTNMWALSEGEYVEGEGGKVVGPAVVRVEEFETNEGILSLVQSGEQKIQLLGCFPDVVKKR